MKHVTRIAPSPTGDFHIGTARTAYFNYLAAKASGGRFILRIDDTDQTRNNDDFIKVIYDTMTWLGIEYDATFKQSDNFDRYRWVADWMLSFGLAEEKENKAVALIMPKNMPTTWIDNIGGEIPITKKDCEFIDGLILLRGDGMPTYHFSTVVDDMDWCINHVIRGTDHISNTAKHIAIQVALGAEIPQYSHVGLIHKNKKKMSKRDSDPTVSMLYYKEKGYDTDAILNFLLRMGWGPTIDDKSTSMLDRSKAIELFLNGGSMRSAPSNFDQAKLDSFDRKYKGKKENAGR